MLRSCVMLLPSLLFAAGNLSPVTVLPQESAVPTGAALVTGRLAPAGAPLEVAIGTLDTIGGTTYDWQANGPGWRMLVGSPGHGIHALWLYSSSTSGTTFPDRNMRYNFYDASTHDWKWIDEDFMQSGVNVFDKRAGYGSIGADPATGNAIVSGHVASGSNMVPRVARDSTPGHGAFEYADGEQVLGVCQWPPIAVGQDGQINIFPITAAYDLSYSHIMADSWPTFSAPETGWTPSPGFTTHNIAASKVSNKVALVWVVSTDVPEDAYWSRSTNGGITWGSPTNLVPPAAFGSDTVTSYHITSLFPWYDAEDKFHVVANLMPMVDGIGYIFPSQIWHYCPTNSPQWSRIHTASVDPYNYRYSVGYNATLACRPSIGQDNDGNLFVAWEQFDTLNYEPRTSRARADIWVAGSTDGGLNWSTGRKLTTPGTASCRFPSICDGTWPGDSLAVIYEIDQCAGFYVQGEGPVTANPIVVQKIPIDSIVQRVHDTVQVWVPESRTGIVGDTVLIPILISGQEDDSVYSADITLRFGESVLTATGGYDTGDVAHGWSIDTHAFPDSLVIAMAGEHPLGAGDTLLYVKMLVDAADTTTVWFERCLLNEGNVPCTTHAGIFYGAPGTKSISGTVEYYRGTEEGIPDVRLVLSGDVDDTTYTDSSGQYAFTVVVGSDVTVSPERHSVAREPAVSAYDAALVLQHAVHRDTLDSLQFVAGDVTGDHTISAYDAALILRYAVGIIRHFPAGHRTGLDTVDWAFRPPQRAYDSLTLDQEDQDYAGILFGDPSGNWPGSDVLASCQGVATGASRSCFTLNLPASDRAGALVPAITEKSGSNLTPTIVFPMVAHDARDLVSADALVRYDVDRYVLRGVRTTRQTEGYMVAANDRDGYVRIAMAGTKRLDGDVRLLDLVFEPATGAAAQTPSLNLQAPERDGNGGLVATSEAAVGQRLAVGSSTSGAVGSEPSAVSSESPAPSPAVEVVWLVLNEGASDVRGRTGEGAMGEEKELPTAFYLAPPKPNPFGNGTSISYALPFASEAKLCVFDVAGKKVRILADGTQHAGRYSLTWDGCDGKGRRLANGLYFLRMEAQTFRFERKVTLLRR